MEKKFFLFIVFFIRINSQIKENPIFLVNASNPFVLSTNDDYYYAITAGKSLKINKEFGNIENITINNFTNSNYIYIVDDIYNNYIYYSNKYYHIIYSPFISYEEITVHSEQKNGEQNPMIIVGSIPKDNDFIVYGITKMDYLSFSSKSQYYCASTSTEKDDIDERISCKLIENNDYICGIITEENLSINCFKYQIFANSLDDSLTLYRYTLSWTFGSVSSFGLYDIDKNKTNTKLFCRQLIDQNKIFCNIIKFTCGAIDCTPNFLNSFSFFIYGDFSEKNCYCSQFNSEYLFCFGITDYIKCYRINSTDYSIIKEFNIQLHGNNSYIAIKSNSDYFTLFFINNDNNIDSIYEYYIYLPTCINKNYGVFNYLNENNPKKELDKIRNLFIVKSNKYFFEIKNPPDEFGFFIINNKTINQRAQINNNDDILYFIINNNNKSTSFTKIIDYIVSIEDEEAYKAECQISITFKMCYHSCEKCYLDIYDSNDTQHNCINCRKNYYSSPDNKSNCYSIEEKQINWYFDSNLEEFGICSEECLSCSGPTKFECLSSNNELYLNNNTNNNYTRNDSFLYNDDNSYEKFDKEKAVNELKSIILNNITSYISSFKVYNISNILISVISSNKIEPKEHIKRGISAFDLGNCTDIIKEAYNISNEENLIILSLETKNDENNNEENNKSFKLEKNIKLEIYDYSGRKLNLSVCKEDIKIMKYIGDIKELDMNTAKTFSDKGIDIFNPQDKFFNDICHPFDNPYDKDIILKDRRNDIYRNVTFCENGCIYNGINYNLKFANCICKSNVFQEEEQNKIETNENIKFSYFKDIKKVFLENLFSFNIEILRCYNLVLNTKILFHNIGFYSQLTMLFLQIIFVFIYLLKRLNSLKYFMMRFENKKNKNLNDNNINIINKKSQQKVKSKKISSNISNNEIKKQTYKIKKNVDAFEPNKKKKNKNKKFDKGKEKKEETYIKLNLKSLSKTELKKGSSISNNLENNIRIHNINNKNYFVKRNKLNKYNKQQKNINSANKRLVNLNNNNSINNNNQSYTDQDSIKLFQTINDLQDMDYEEAILYDKRGYLKIYWGFLVDSQIILGTFCTDNYLDLFVIKLSFLICTFQINFFLNAFFFTDEYISDAYHNNGVLDFFSGLPKSIYSFIATLITTNLLRMLSNSKSELMRLIKEKRNYKYYVYLIHIKLTKLRKKLVAYFILVYIFSIFFLYYVTAFCAVYRNSQKYWFCGCLESFGMDSLVSFGLCFFLAFCRYLSIKKHIKCLYIFANIISTFL